MHCSATYWHAPFAPSKTPANNPVSLSSPPLSERLPRSPSTPVHSDSAGMNYKPRWGRSRATLCSDHRSHCVRRWSVPEERAKLLSETQQGCEELLTICWASAVALFHFIYASFREKHVDIYFSGGIWICGVDKYLRPTRRVIYQVWSRMGGEGVVFGSVMLAVFFF